MAHVGIRGFRKIRILRATNEPPGFVIFLFSGGRAPRFFAHLVKRTVFRGYLGSGKIGIYMHLDAKIVGYPMVHVSLAIYGALSRYDFFCV